MVGAFTQDTRLAAVHSPAGEDVLVLERMTAHEQLSELFTISINVLTESKTVDFESMLGAGVSVTMQAAQGVARAFHGLLFEASFEGGSSAGYHYRLLLRPWTALLGLTLNTRIFQTQTATQIVKAVFDKAGMSAYDIRVSAALGTREYCVQFRESDLNFVSRLLEEEGLLYYFEHTQDKHTLVITDQIKAEAPGLASIPYYEAGGRDIRAPHIARWGDQMSPVPNKVTLRDHHYLQTGKSLEGVAAAKPYGPANELYDFPGGQETYGASDAAKQGGQYAQWRLDAARAEARRLSGEGDCFAIFCGAKFELTRHALDRMNTTYRVTGTTHSLSSESYRSGGGGGYQLDVAIEATPLEVAWRPQLRTPKPLAGGPQTATVVGAQNADPGPKGEVLVDKYGRVKVQFHWDRAGAFDQHSTCWIRVAQGFADAGFGAMHIPRVGEEVVVDFLEGDPDRPLITGRVYNDAQMPPYALPDNKTRWTWKSRTLGVTGPYPDAENPPSGEQGSNELRFEDKGGSEEVFLHAQRDYSVWARFDEQRKTGRDVAVRVGRDRRTEVHRNETVVVETGDEVRQVQQGSRTTTIKANDTETVQSGDYSLKISSGKATIEAATEILLKVGNNTIKISPSGIEVQGMTVKMTADTSLSAQGLTTELKASTLLTINGLPVQIN